MRKTELKAEAGTERLEPAAAAAQAAPGIANPAVPPPASPAGAVPAAGTRPVPPGFERAAEGVLTCSPVRAPLRAAARSGMRAAARTLRRPAADATVLAPGTSRRPCGAAGTTGVRISAYRAAHLEAPAAAPAGNLRAPAAPAALLAAFLAAFLAAPALLAGPNVLDLNQLNALGISQETVRDIVTESLSQRGRPPMDADLILSLSRYGGEPLMRAYLDLDRESRLAPEPPLSREAVMAMMARLEGRDEIIRRIDTIRSHTKEAGRPAKRARSKGPAGGGKAERPSAPSAGDVSVEEGDLPGDFNNKGAAPAAGASPSAGAAPGAGTAPGAAAAAETPAAVPSPGAGASAAAYPPAADPAGTPAVGADAPGALPRRAASPAALAAAGSVPGSGPYIQGIIHASGSPVATSPGSASDAAEAAFAYEEFQSGAAADAPEGSASRAAAGAMSENEGALALGGAGSQLALGTPKPEAGGPEGGKPAEPARGPEPSVTAGASEPAEDGWRAASETRTADAGTYQAWTSSEGATLHMGTFQALTPDGHRVRVHRNARMSGAAPSAE